ncbi:MAG: IS66 family transposase [Labilithrix sp.]
MLAGGHRDEASALRREVELLRTALATKESELAVVKVERDKLRRAYEQLKEQVELLRRRIFQARAERVDVTQLEIEFAETKQKLDAIVQQVAETAGLSELLPDNDPPESGRRPRPNRSGRRDLRDEDLPEERIEIPDPALEGKAKRIGFEESCRRSYRRGGAIRLVVARVKYKNEVVTERASGDVVDEVDEHGRKTGFQIITAPMPKELFKRGLLAPSLIAHILASKYRFGIPFHRLSEMLRADGCPVDDSVMCRYAEDAGNTFGCIVDAMAKEAKEDAFCLSTDATGVCIQPEPVKGGPRGACRKGHFFVVLADQDHIFFEYQPKHTSKAVCEMFRGFGGYIQADAHCIYDALYRGEARDPGETPPKEVGCWSHARRRAWEAATVAKDPAAREALLRMHKLFELEAQWAALPPRRRHELRQLLARPLLDDFFAWAKTRYEGLKAVRGLAATAFGYVVRQEQALRRYLDDGRLRMTNNHSERAVRPIAVGRRAWFFFGSDDHATAAANLFSLIASCQLHGIDAELYLRDIIRVLPYWPRDRYLELAPKYWSLTLGRLDPKQLEPELGDIAVPAPLPRAAKQEISPD